MGSEMSKRLEEEIIDGNLIKKLEYNHVLYEDKILYFDSSIMKDCYQILKEIKGTNKKTTILTNYSYLKDNNLSDKHIILYIEDDNKTGHPSNKIVPQSSGWYFRAKL